MSPAMLTPDTSLRSCGSGVQLRGGRGNSKRDAASPPTNGATSVSHASNVAASFPQPACQPMPVHVLVHLLEHLSSHRPPAKDSRAILHALHDYIGDAISQPGLSPASQSSNDFDAATSASPLPWAATAQAVHSASPGHDLPGNGASTNGAVASMQPKQSYGPFTSAPAEEVSGSSAVLMPAAAPAAASASLQEHIMRWSADLGILQAMYSAGFSEGEVEAFVTKLLPGLAEGVKSQLSQAGVQLGGLATSAPSPSAPPATSGTDAESPSAASSERFSAVTRDLPPLVSGAGDAKGAVDAASADATPGPSDGAPAAPSAVPPLPPFPVGGAGAVVTDRVSPFIQRPYHLLQQLHEHAKTRGAGASGSISGVSSGSGSGRAASDIESASSLSKPCGMPLKNGGSPSSPPASPPASKPGSTSASPTSTPQGPTDASEDSGSIFAAQGKVADADGSDVAPPVAGYASANKQPACDPGARSDAGGGGGEQLHVSAGWKSVLDMLISAGPQAVQPAASYVPTYAWGSGNSSTEPDTFSAKSEDPAHGGAGSGDSTAAPVATTASSSKSKKRRNKRSKNGSRGGA